MQGGLPYAIARSLAVAPYADILWMETNTANLDDARQFAEAIHARYLIMEIENHIIVMDYALDRQGHRNRKSTMPVVKHEAFFRRHPVFTGAELGAHLTSRGEVGDRGQEALLAYYTKTGRVVRVRRGLYAVIPPGADPGSYPVDSYLVAAKLTQDAVLSHHTALEFHGRAYSIWSHLIYSACRPVGPLTFRSQVFQGAKFPEALLRSGTMHFGVLTSERSGVAIRVTSLERTLVDVLHRPELSGGWEEIWRSLETVAGQRRIPQPANQHFRSAPSDDAGVVGKSGAGGHRVGVLLDESASCRYGCLRLPCAPGGLPSYHFAWWDAPQEATWRSRTPGGRYGRLIPRF